MHNLGRGDTISDAILMCAHDSASAAWAKRLVLDVQVPRYPATTGQLGMDRVPEHLPVWQYSAVVDRLVGRRGERVGASGGNEETSRLRPALR
jgi:hypothetical protein